MPSIEVSLLGPGRRSGSGRGRGSRRARTRRDARQRTKRSFARLRRRGERVGTVGERCARDDPDDPEDPGDSGVVCDFDVDVDGWNDVPRDGAIDGGFGKGGGAERAPRVRRRRGPSPRLREAEYSADWDEDDAEVAGSNPTEVDLGGRVKMSADGTFPLAAPQTAAAGGRRRRPRRRMRSGGRRRRPRRRMRSGGRRRRPRRRMRNVRDAREGLACSATR